MDKKIIKTKGLKKNRHFKQNAICKKRRRSLMSEELLTIKEAAKYLNLNEEGVRKLVESEKIKAIRQGDLWKFKKSSVLDVLNYQMKSVPNEELVHLEIDEEKQSIQIHSLIKEENIILNMLAHTKNTALQELCDTFAKGKRKDKKEILLKAVRDREMLCTTAITEGVAIPHPRRAVKNLVKKPLIIFGRSLVGVDFESLDGNPTQLFFLVCAPKDDIHLKIMARLSRLLRNFDFRKELLEAKNKEEIITIITKFESADKINI